jgi:hypothetical protein
MEQLTEFDLVVRFRDAKAKKDELEKILELAQQEFDKAEADLIELLNAKNATKTAEYEGVGHVTLLKPRLYASVLKENQDKLFSFLRETRRDDLIREVVNPQSLSGYVKEALDSGQQVPEFINYYLKPSAKFFGA